MANTPLLQLSGLRKSYKLGQPNAAEVLHGIDLHIAAGEFVALIGPSGSGKSTLLNILGLLEPATEGSYRLQGAELAGLPDAALTRRRREALGFVFQFHHLLPAFTALENVTLPALMAAGRVTAGERALLELERVGLGGLAARTPNQLSGGQQQRVAIARALATDPPLLLADEPTGNLDTQTSDDIMHSFRQLNVERGITIVLVTHEPDIAACSRRLVRLKDGRVLYDGPAADGLRQFAPVAAGVAP